MTGIQENQLHQAQIQGDVIRRNMVNAFSHDPANTQLAKDIKSFDTARIAAGQTIEYSPSVLMATGAIPGTTGLALGTAPNGVAITVPTPTATPTKNG